MLLAQITDPHIKANRRTAYGFVDTAGFLEAAIDHINMFIPQIDAVIVTGDIADSGHEDDYAAAIPILERLSVPWYTVPGNHDDRTNLRSALPTHRHLDQCKSHIQYVIDDYRVRLVGLDTSVPGQPHGFLCRERLDWLDTTLKSKPEKATFIFFHHPPFETGIRHMDVQKLSNPDDLFAILANHPQVRHIACGHVHRAIETTIHGIGVSIAPNTAHSVTLALSADAPSSFTMDPPALRIFRFTEHGEVVSHLSYVGDFKGPHPFFTPDGQLID